MGPTATGKKWGALAAMMMSTRAKTMVEATRMTSAATGLASGACAVRRE